MIFPAANIPREITFGINKKASLSTKKFLIKFKSNFDHTHIIQVLSTCNLIFEDFDNNFNRTALYGCVNHAKRTFWVKSRNECIDFKSFSRAINSELTGVADWIAPVYRTKDGDFFAARPDVLVLKQDCPADLVKAIRSSGWEKDKFRSELLFDKLLYCHELGKEGIFSEGFFEDCYNADFCSLEWIPLKKPFHNRTTSDDLIELLLDEIEGRLPQQMENEDRSTFLIANIDHYVENKQGEMDANAKDFNFSNLNDNSPQIEKDPYINADLMRLFSEELAKSYEITNSSISSFTIALNYYSDLEVALGINYACINGAKIINVNIPGILSFSSVLSDALNDACKKNVIVVSKKMMYDHHCTANLYNLELGDATNSGLSVYNRKDPIQLWYLDEKNKRLAYEFIDLDYDLGEIIRNELTKSRAGDSLLSISISAAGTSMFSSMCVVLLLMFPILKLKDVKYLFSRSIAVSKAITFASLLFHASTPKVNSGFIKKTYNENYLNQAM